MQTVKIKVPAHVFDYLYLISLVYPHDIFWMSTNQMLQVEEYFEVTNVLVSSLYRTFGNIYPHELLTRFEWELT